MRDVRRESGCRSPGCLAPQLASEIDFAFRKLCGERGNPEALKAGKRGNPDLVFQPGPISRDLPGPVWNGSDDEDWAGPRARAHGAQSFRRPVQALLENSKTASFLGISALSFRLFRNFVMDSACFGSDFL